MKKGLFFGSIMLILVLILLVACTPAAPSTTGTVATTTTTPAAKITWKLSFFAGPPNDVIGNGLDWWAKEVTSRSKGQLEVQTFYFGTLAQGGQEFEGVKSGLFQVADFIPAYNPSALPLMNLQFLPCLIPTATSDDTKDFPIFMKIQDEFLRSAPLTEELNRWDAQLLFATACPEYYRLISNVSITSLDDLKGKKIRAVSGIGDLLTKAGATTVATAGPEMYDAMSKNVVQAVCHAPSLFVNNKLIEVAKYYIPGINLGNMGGTPVVSKSAYNKLPADLKKIVDDVSKEAFDKTTKLWIDAEAGWLKAIKDKGVQEIKFSADSQKQLVQMSSSIWADSVNKLESQGMKGKATFNAFQDAIKRNIPSFELNYMK